MRTQLAQGVQAVSDAVNFLVETKDPRVTFVAELDRWIVTYTSFGPEGPGVSLAQTEDFRTFERLGMVMSPEDKNAALLPRRIAGFGDVSTLLSDMAGEGDVPPVHGVVVPDEERAHA